MASGDIGLMSKLHVDGVHDCSALPRRKAAEMFDGSYGVVNFMGHEPVLGINSPFSSLRIIAISTILCRRVLSAGPRNAIRCGRTAQV
jgi:hypothetical protein